MADGGRRPCGDPVAKTDDRLSCWHLGPNGADQSLARNHSVAEKLPKESLPDLGFVWGPNRLALECLRGSSGPGPVR